MENRYPDEAHMFRSKNGSQAPFKITRFLAQAQIAPEKYLP